jgi:hypothetical protein
VKNPARWRTPRVLTLGAWVLALMMLLARGNAMPAAAQVATASHLPAPTDPTRCQFATIGITAAGLGAAPGLWDTAPSSPAGRVVYFTRPAQAGGQITLTISLSNYPANHTCYLYNNTAFDVAARTAPLTEGQPALLSFPVTVTSTSQTLSLIAADTFSGTVQVAPHTIDFLLDDAAPSFSAPGIDTGSGGRLYATGRRLFYGALSAAVPFTVTGSADDAPVGGSAASGLAQVSFAPAFGRTPPPAGDPTPANPLSWTATYTLPAGLSEAGLITATGVDRVGNLAAQTFSYAPDLVSPTSRVTATVGTSLGGQTIPLHFGAADTGAGVREVALFYKTDQAGSAWSLWPSVALDTQSGLFAFIPPVRPLTGAITYYFNSRAIDRVGNAEIQRTTADTAVTVYPFHVSMPAITRNYISFSNGSFEQGWGNWAATTGAFPASRVQGQTHGAGVWSALLGSPAFKGSGDVPTGHSSVWQTFSVPPSGTPNGAAPRLTLWYHVLTYDMVFGYQTARYYDSFEIYVNQDPAVGDVPSPADARRQRLCRDHLAQPDTTQVGLVFCDGGPTRAGNALVDLGWRTVTLDLTAFRGQNITLYLANYNRVDGYYNTWTYVDDMSIN